jgi:GDP-4-dehydro-6-deoxy-D-mannose reductase
MPQSILVTGASGFVGRHLLTALRLAFPDAKLIPTSRRAGVDIDGGEAVQLDLERPEAARPIVDGLKPDVIVHLAAEAAVNRAAADPMAVWRSNFWHTIEFAEIVREQSPGTAFIFVSSASVYGLASLTHARLDEDAPLQPANAYGVTKAAADLAIGEMALRGLHAIRLRPFNHTGPGQSAHFVVPALARQIARIEAGLQEPVIRTEATDAARDFLDVRDVCAAYAEVVRQAARLPPGTVLNIASGTPRRIADVVASMVEISHTKPRIESESRPRPNEIPMVCGDASKAEALLGWRPQIPFERTLSDTLDWWRGQMRLAS